MPDFGLGRLPDFDERSRAFPIRAALPAAAAPRSYTWSCPLYLNQGSEGSCVGHAPVCPRNDEAYAGGPPKEKTK